MTHTYAFVGLTPSERALLESLFTFDDDAAQQLVCVREPEQADLILVNGDDACVVERLRQDHAGALIVLVGQARGSHAVTGLPVIRRPLELNNAVAVLSTLDWPETSRGGDRTDFGEFQPTEPGQGMSSPPTVPPTTVPQGAGDSLSSAAAFAPTTASLPPAVAGAAPLPPTPLSARHSWAVSETAVLTSGSGQRDGPEPALEGDVPDVLVVTLRRGEREPTLPRGIRRLGYRVQVVEGVRTALQLLERRPVPFVFLDQASLGDHMLPLARALQARQVPDMHVVVVARRGSVFDRLRARAAGCSWMLVPIERDRLVAFFARRGLHRRA